MADKITARRSLDGAKRSYDVYRKTLTKERCIGGVCKVGGVWVARLPGVSRREDAMKMLGIVNEAMAQGGSSGSDRL